MNLDLTKSGDDVVKQIVHELDMLTEARRANARLAPDSMQSYIDGFADGVERVSTLLWRTVNGRS